MRHSDTFRSLVLPKIGTRVENWENSSEDDEGSADTFEDCRGACQNKPDCMQFVYYADDQTCKSSKVIKLGRRQGKHKQNGKKVISGWMTDRVDAFVETMDAECSNSETEWKLPD